MSSVKGHFHGGAGPDQNIEYEYFIFYMHVLYSLDFVVIWTYQKLIVKWQVICCKSVKLKMYLNMLPQSIMALQKHFVVDHK